MNAASGPGEAPAPHRQHAAPAREPLGPALLLTALFFVIVAFGISQHEMWRDEWQAWMLARDSGSLLELFGHLRYEGHPPAWYVPLFLLSRFTRNPLAMQGLHLAIATASVFLLARFAPLRWHYRVLIAFSYFLAYEYAVIARSYAPGVLALFTFCALYPTRRRLGLPLLAVLLLLASTSVYTLIIAAVAAGMLLLEEVCTRGRVTAWDARRYAAAVAMTGWMVLAVIFSLLIHALERPSWGAPADEGQWNTVWGLGITLSKLNRAYLPIPDFTTSHIWESFLLTTGSLGAFALAVAVSLLLLAAGLLLLARKPYVLFLYLTGTALLLAFRHFVFSGSIRHTGHLFLLLVACLWLARLPGREWRFSPRVHDWLKHGERAAHALLTVVLLVQCAIALFFYRADVQRPFSAAPQVAAYLTQARLTHLPLAAAPGPEASPIAGILEKPIHYFDVGYPGTFILWHDFLGRGQHGFSWPRLRAVLDRSDGELLLMLGFPLQHIPGDIAAEQLAAIPPGIVESEHYFLYRVRRPVR